MRLTLTLLLLSTASAIAQDLHTFEYDELGRLIGVEIGTSGPEISFVYDPNGNRISKLIEGAAPATVRTEGGVYFTPFAPTQINTLSKIAPACGPVSGCLEN